MTLLENRGNLENRKKKRLHYKSALLVFRKSSKKWQKLQ